MCIVRLMVGAHVYSVTRRKQQRPGIASNDNTTHVPTARSSADPTKPNHTPMQHTRAKEKMILKMFTRQAASSQRTHVSRTHGRARMHPVTRRVTTQYLHSQIYSVVRLLSGWGLVVGGFDCAVVLSFLAILA